jgi:hypothetical protein
MAIVVVASYPAILLMVLTGMLAPVLIQVLAAISIAAIPIAVI